VLVNPPTGVAFGIQKGRGAQYDTLLVQEGGDDDLCFDFSLTLKSDRPNEAPNFVGPFAQGTAADRFVYIDVGTLAGQKDSCWSRRIKIPLKGITKTLLRDLASRPERRLVARIPGTGRDGTPSCATVSILGGWEVIRV
jgi:Family of unknown function (DUF5990)